MKLFRLDFEGPLVAAVGKTASLLDDHRHRIRLIEKPEFATGILHCGWIDEDPTVHQDPMYISHHGTDVAAGISVLVRPLEIRSITGGKLFGIRFIHGIGLVSGRNAKSTFNMKE